MQRVQIQISVSIRIHFRVGCSPCSPTKNAGVASDYRWTVVERTLALDYRGYRMAIQRFAGRLSEVVHDCQKQNPWQQNDQCGDNQRLQEIAPSCLAPDYRKIYKGASHRRQHRRGSSNFGGNLAMNHHGRGGGGGAGTTHQSAEQADDYHSRLSEVTCPERAGNLNGKEQPSELQYL